MKFRDLREFLDTLEANGDLVGIKEEIDPNLEMTEIADRTLRGGGPALLFENPKGYDTPLLANLFGTEKRVALGMGADSIEALREIGELLAYLRQPDPPKGMRDLIDKAPLLKKVLNMGPKIINRPPCQDIVLKGDDIDLTTLPIQTCWPGDVGPLVTWPLVITRGPEKPRARHAQARHRHLALWREPSREQAVRRYPKAHRRHRPQGPRGSRCARTGGV